MRAEIETRDMVVGALQKSLAEAKLAQVRHERGWNWPKWFRISSGNGRVCTTFALKSKMFRQVDSELAE